MRVVTESWDVLNIRVRVSYPYLFALEIMDAAKQFGVIKERVNAVEADEIEAEVNVVFDIVKKLDDHAKSKISVEISGDDKKGFLDIRLKPRLVMVFKDSPETFNEFYVKELLPELRKVAKAHVDEFTEQLKNKIEVLVSDNYENSNKDEDRESEV
jgi:hypothetical protein